MHMQNADHAELFSNVRKTLEGNIIFFPFLAAFEAVATLPWDKLSDDAHVTVYHNIRSWIIAPQHQPSMSPKQELEAVKDAGVNLFAAANFFAEELAESNGDPTAILAAKKAADLVHHSLDIALAMARRSGN